jgi:predicted ATPase
MPVHQIKTPDQRLRVFVSSTLGELAPERDAVRAAVEALHLAPVMFELGARPHPPRSLYRAYLAQSHVFIGIYWQKYGWVAPGESISGLEDEYRLAGDRPRLLYIKEPGPQREEKLTALIRDFQSDDQASYKRFESLEQLQRLTMDDLALLLTERFEATAGDGSREKPRPVASTAPVPLTRIMGRGEEIELVLRRLNQGKRLVTLTGPGGVGKTRLALEAARLLSDDQSLITHFVPLAHVNDASLLARTIDDHIGLRPEGSWTATDALLDYLADRRVVLILDNLEQIHDVERELRDLLERRPSLQILTTSRRALRIAGEQEIQLSPLPLPDIAQPVEVLAEAPCVQLFVDRAQEANAAFAFDEPNARAVAGVCRRLDGLPLAIELAAARCRLLPPATLLQRLDDGLEILKARSPDLPERQQTLRATLEWSHALLEDQEQALLARLSVFQETFSLEAAEYVCDLDSSCDIADSLTALLDNSLVLAADDLAPIEPRFRMLETLRAFAAEQLDRRGEKDAVMDRHLDWYLRLSDSAQPFLCGPNQREWAARFDPERANLRAAVDTAFARNDLSAVIELLWDVAVFYEIRDASEEPRAWLQELLRRADELDELACSKVRSLGAMMGVDAGDYVGAQDRLESAHSVLRAHGLGLETAVTLMVLSDMYFTIDHDSAHAESVLKEATRLFASLGHDWGVARTEIILATRLWSSGDKTGAAEHLRRSLVHSRLIGNEPQMARALSLLAMLARDGDDVAEGIVCVREAAEIVVRGRYRTEATICLDALGAALLDNFENEAAARTVALSAAVRRSLGLPLLPGAAEFVEALSEEVMAGVGRDAFDGLRGSAETEEVFDFIARTVNALRGP